MTQGFTLLANTFLYITLILMSGSIVGADEHESATQAEWHQWRRRESGWNLPRNGNPQSVAQDGTKRVVAGPAWRGFFGDLSCERTRLYHVCQGRG